MQRKGKGSASADPVRDIQALTRAELIDFIELDLWNRFQSRLWKAVAAAVTAATLAGLVGVPFYIKSQLNERLQQRAVDFESRTREMFAYSKLLSLLSAKYATQLATLQSDALRLAETLEPVPNKRSERVSYFRERLRIALLVLAAETDTAAVIKNEHLMFNLFGEANGDELSAFAPEILPRDADAFPAIITPDAHPVRDGTIAGELRDLRFRIVVLEALRRSMKAVEQQLLALGGATKLDGDIEAVRAHSIERDVFEIEFGKNVSTVGGTLLPEADQTQFKKASSSYLLGYGVEILDMSKLQPPVAEQRSSATHARLQ